MANHKPFRELVNPNSNFEFVEKRRRWVTVSVLLMIACIGMLFVNKSWRGDYLNWSIDFKGGTEMIFGFEQGGQPVEVPTGEVRAALQAAGMENFEVSDFVWSREGEGGQDVRVPGMLVRTIEFGAVPADEQRTIAAAFGERFGAVENTQWAGDRMFVRATAPIDWEEARQFFEQQGLTLREWGDQADSFATPMEGTNEYRMQFSVRGIDAQFQRALEESLAEDIEVSVINVYGVGAKAGAKLRNDGIKALFYAMGLIMLYLAFRFDVRYAPGAVVALLHDAVIVVGAFAVTWQEVSLTTVAAILTIIGYSVNDTVVIFDRIRENVERLKDKKFSRIINISINETMGRTILTSLTLFVVTVMMNVFSTGLVANFAFAMNVGIISGVYSTIFIASTVALGIHNRWFATPTATAHPK